MEVDNHLFVWEIVFQGAIIHFMLVPLECKFDHLNLEDVVPHVPFLGGCLETTCASQWLNSGSAQAVGQR